MTDKDHDPAEHSNSENCPHAKIEIVGGGGDENGFYDIFECVACGWQFEILVDGDVEF